MRDEGGFEGAWRGKALSGDYGRMAGIEEKR